MVRSNERQEGSTGISLSLKTILSSLSSGHAASPQNRQTAFQRLPSSHSSARHMNFLQGSSPYSYFGGAHCQISPAPLTAVSGLLYLCWPPPRSSQHTHTVNLKVDSTRSGSVSWLNPKKPSPASNHNSTKPVTPEECQTMQIRSLSKLLKPKG